MTTTSSTPPPSISIVLADDHQVVVEGFKALLAGEPDFRVIGEAADGTAALAAVEKLRPDVLVVDLMMPGVNGLEVVRQLRERAPGTRACVLSMHATDAYVVEALRAGASAYVLKQAPARALVEAIRAIAAGRRYLSPPLSEEQLATYEARARATARDAYDTLSAREREVLTLAAQGLTSAEIGARLGIGKRTVETHRANVLAKLPIKSQAELVRYAIKKGLISVDD
jgi:DNA-binding NarL/FixJ family response regulator